MDEGEEAEGPKETGGGGGQVGPGRQRGRGLGHQQHRVHSNREGGASEGCGGVGGEGGCSGLCGHLPWVSQS